MTIIDAIKAMDDTHSFIARDAWRAATGYLYMRIDPTDVSELKCRAYSSNFEDSPFHDNWAPFRADLLATDWYPVDYHGKA